VRTAAEESGESLNGLLIREGAKKMERTALINKGANTIRMFRYIALAALAFQAVHLVEHLAQFGYWTTHPSEAPWLTPWAAQGRDALAVGGEAALGNELLHLLGNLVFLGGLLAMVMLFRTAGGAPGDLRSLRTATMIQGVHVAEHVALTTTSFLFGKAIGLSTFLGLVEGPAMTSYRVWFHFLINLVASLYAARALRGLTGYAPLKDGRFRQPMAETNV
jgi:hypothetical protein